MGDWINKLPHQRAVLADVLDQVRDLPPTQAANIIRYAQEYQVPAQQVAVDYQQYDAGEIDRVNWQKLKDDAPKTAKFLEDPYYMAVVRNNANHLSNIESGWNVWQTVENIGAAIEEGKKDLIRNGLSHLRGFLDLAALDRKAEDVPGGMPPEYQMWRDAGGKDALKAAGQAIKEITEQPQLASKEVTSDWGPKIPIVDRSLGQLGLDVVRAGPQLVAQAGAYAVGGAGASLAFMGSQIIGSDYEQLRAKGIDTERAMKAAIGDAIPQAFLEQISLNRIFKAIKTKPGGGWGDLKEVGQVAFTEFVTEFAQQYPQAIAEIWATNPGASVQELERKFVDQSWDIFKEALYSGLVALPLGGAAGSIKVGLHRRGREEKRTQAFVQTNEEIQKGIANSPISQLSPELMEQHLNAVTDGSHVYIDPNALLLHQQSNEQVFDQLGLRQEDIVQAAQTGQLIEVPIGKYDVAAAQHPELHQALKDDIAPDAEGYTKRRLAEYNEKEVAKAQEEVWRQQTELDDVIQKIRDNMREAGVPKQQAEDLMVVMTGNARVMSESMGKTQAQWMKDYGPIFRRGTAPVDGVMSQAAMYRNPAKTITEFRDFVVANEGNPKETNKSYFTFKTADGANVSIGFSEMTHIEKGHKLSDKQWQAVVEHLDNIEYAYTDKQKGKKDGTPVLLKINTPLGKAGVVLEFLPNGRIFMNTAFFDGDMNIDNWAKQKSPIVLGPKASGDAQGAPINQHSYGNSSIKKIQQYLGNVNQDLLPMFQPLNLDVDADTKVNAVDITEALPKEFVGNKDLLDHVRALIKNNTVLSTADQKAIVDILPKSARHIVYSSRKVPGTADIRKGSLLSISDLMKNAVLIESTPNKKTDKKPDVAVYHRFYVPVIFKEKAYTIRLVAEERHGKITVNPISVNLYDIIIENKETLLADQPTSGRSSDLVPAKGSFSSTIREMISGVKDVEGVNNFIEKKQEALLANQPTSQSESSGLMPAKDSFPSTIREVLSGVKDTEGVNHFMENKEILPTHRLTSENRSTNDIVSPTGVNLYDALIERQGRSIPLDQPAKSSDLITAPERPNTFTIREMLAGVKDAEGVNYFQDASKPGALFQPLNLDVDADTKVNAVDITDALPKEFVGNKDLLDHVRALIKNNTVLSTADQKAIVDVLPKGAKHIVHSSRKVGGRELTLRKGGLLSIKELIQNAVLIESTPNKKTGKKPDVAVYHRFYVPVTFKGKTYTIRLVAEERQGNITVNPASVSLYDVLVERQGRSIPLYQPTSQGESSDIMAAQERPNTFTIREMLAGVKDAEGVNYFQDASSKPGALFQPLNFDVDADTKVNAVDITDALPKESVSNKDLLDHVQGLIKNNTALSTADQKAIIDILPKSARHIVYSSRKNVKDREIAIRKSGLLSIVDLMQNAVLIESTPNKKTGKKPDVAVYHRFYVPVMFKGKAYTIRLVAEERQGNISLSPTSVNLYDIIIENKKLFPTNQPTSQSESTGLVPAKSSFSFTIREMLDGVKDADGVNYFQDESKPGALFQPLNFDVDADTKVNVVDITEALPKAFVGNKDLLSHVKELIKNNTALSTADQKAVMDILPKSARHIVYSSRHDLKKSELILRKKSLLSIVDLMQNAVLIESTPNKKTGKKPDVAVYHRFYVPVMFKGKAYTIRLVAEERQGNITLSPTNVNLYDIIIENKELFLANQPTSQSGSTGLGPAKSSFSTTIREMLAGVKDTDGVNYFQNTSTPGALFQPLNANVNLSKQVAITTIEPKLQNQQWWQLRKKKGFPQEIREGVLSSSPIVNTETGWQIAVTKGSFDHFTNTAKGGDESSRQTTEHFEIIAALPQLLKHAALIETHADSKSGSPPAKVHRFYAPAQINNDLHIVKITVKEHANGFKVEKGEVYTYRAYDHSIAKKMPIQNKEPVGTSPINGKATVPEPATGSLNISEGTSPTAAQKDFALEPATDSSTISIREMLENINDNSGHRYFADSRGMIHWEEGRAIITLFENADASTLIHELVGHHFTQNIIEQGALDTAPEWMKKDRQKLLDYAGVVDWEALTKEQKAAAHEKWANAAERYVMEGKAPSKELRSVFKRFKDWMLSIYKTIRSIGGKVDPQIAEVFDRMLASEAEIAQMAAVEGYMRRLPDHVYDNLSETARRDLENQLDRVREQAEARVRAKVMPFIQADNKRRMAEERHVAKVRLTEEVAKEPVYAATAQIKQQVGSHVREIAEAYHNFMIEEDQGLAVDMIANMHGFTSGDELAVRILQGPTLAEAVNARVKDHMRQFRDMLQDKAALDAEIRETMYSDEGALLLAAEQQIIAEKLGQVLTRAESRQQTKVRAALAKQAAKNDIGAMPLEKAMRLQTWIAAERRAAEKSAVLLSKKRFGEAAEWKAIQLYNHAMVIESLQARREFDRISRYLKKQQTAKRDTWKKEEHFVQAADILRRFGFVHKELKAGMKEESLAEWATRMDETMDAVEIAPWLFSEHGDKPIGQLMLDEVKDIENALRNIKHLAQREQMYATLFKGVEVQAVMSMIQDEVRGKTDVYQLKLGDDSSHDGFLDTTKKVAQQYRFSIKKFSNIVLAMDNFQDFGLFNKLLYEPFYKAQNIASNHINKMKQQLDTALESNYNEQERKAMNKLQYYEELGGSVSKHLLIEMASHLGTKSNRARLFESVPVGAEQSKLWVEGNSELTGKNVIEFLGRNLTEQDWRYVQAGWDIVGSLFSEANELQKRTKGFGMDKIEALPFTVLAADGKQLALRGGYYPLRQDARGSIRGAQQEAEGKPLYAERMNVFAPATRTGYTHARTNAKYPVDLSPANRFRHMQAVVHDIAFREVVNDMRRLTSNQEFKDIITRKFGRETFDSIMDFVAAASTSRTDAASVGDKTMDSIANFLRSHTVAANLLFRTKTVMQNLANPFLYGQAVEGFTHMDAVRAILNRGVFSSWSDFPAARAFVMDKSAFMRDKSAAPDFMLKEYQDKLAGKEDKIVTWGSWLLAESDNLSNVPMWLEAYHKKIDAGATEYEAVRFADTLIDRTTGSGRKIDTASLLRGNSVQRLLTMFQTFMNTQYNAWSREKGIFLRDRDVLRLTSFVASRYLLFAIASVVLGGGAPDGDDEEWGKEWAKEVLTYPMQLLPIIGPAGTVALDNMLGVKTFGYRLSPAQAIMETPGKVSAAAKGYLEGRREAEDLLEAAMAAGALARPYPDQFNDWFWNGYDILFNDMEPEVGDVFGRRPKRER